MWATFVQLQPIFNTLIFFAVKGNHFLNYRKGGNKLIIVIPSQLFLNEFTCSCFHICCRHCSFSNPIGGWFSTFQFDNGVFSTNSFFQILNTVKAIHLKNFTTQKFTVKRIKWGKFSVLQIVGLLEPLVREKSFPLLYFMCFQSAYRKRSSNENFQKIGKLTITALEIDKLVLY